MCSPSPRVCVCVCEEVAESSPPALREHGGGRRDDEVPLSSGVPVRQQGDGLQLQRPEEVQHLEEAVDLPGPGGEGL